MQRIVGVGLLALMAAPGLAEEPLPEVHALVGGTVVARPGVVVENATIVLRDGWITGFGAAVEPPSDARVWDLSEKTVYAGFLDAYVEVAWPESAVTAEVDDTSLHERPIVRPGRSAATAMFPAADAERLRAAGFTTAVITPSPGLFRGTSAVVNLGDGGRGENLLVENLWHHAALTTDTDGGYPDSLMGAVALFRQTIEDARWYQRRTESGPSRSARRPLWTSAWDDLRPIVDGEVAIAFTADDTHDTLRVAGLADELDLRAVVIGHGSEYQRLEAVAATGLPHVLPVAFPEAPEGLTDDDPNVELSELRHWDRAPANPSELSNAGVTFAITSHGLSSPADVHDRIDRSIERGLTSETALAALTTTPAALLGVNDLLGEVASGRLGNLVVVDGELFGGGGTITEVWVDGRRFELEELEAPSVEPAGVWSVRVITGDGEEIPVELRLQGTADQLTGSLGAMGAEIVLDDLRVSGDTVKIGFDGTPFGMPGPFTLSLTVSGDSMSGSGQSPLGPFEMKGRRVGGATPELGGAR